MSTHESAGWSAMWRTRGVTVEDAAMMHATIAAQKRVIDAQAKLLVAYRGPLAEIASERVAQDAKWGGTAHDQTHTPLEWAGLLAKHTGKLAAHHFDGDWPAYRHRLTVIAALAVAAAENFDLDRAHHATPQAGEDA